MSTADLGPRATLHEPDPYLQWDGAYVVGALSSSERREFERHLAGCRGCQRAVSELAGIPGLLAQVPPEDAALLTVGAERVDGDPPAELMPALRARIRRRRQRLLVGIGSIAAALVLLFAGVGVLASRGVIPIGTHSSYRVAFSPVVMDSGITANVVVTPGRSETGLQLECQYAHPASSTPGSDGVYAIWVRDRSGNESELKSWPVKPNKVMRPSATAPIATWRLDRVEIREATTGQLLSIAPVH